MDCKTQWGFTLQQLVQFTDGKSFSYEVLNACEVIQTWT